MKSKYGERPYKLSVVDQRALDGSAVDGQVVTGVTAFVYDAGTKTLATIYGGPNRETLANPITRTQFATDTCIKFWGASDSYDIVINDDKGNVASQAAVAPETHTMPIDRTGSEKVLVFPMVFNAGGTVVDTGLDLPIGCAVHDVAVEVVTVDATETVDIGLLATETAGDEDGFCAAVSVATAGFPALSTYTVGSNETYLAACTYGVLLASRSLGTDVATDVGSFARLRHHVTGTNAKSITYTPSSSDTFAGYGYVFFRVLR